MIVFPHVFCEGDMRKRNWREEEKRGEERTHLRRKERDLETWREKARDSSRRGIRRHVAPLYSVFAI